LIIEANENGARLIKACEALEISMSTFERWRKGNYRDNRKGAVKVVARKLSPEERQQILDLCCSNKYKDANPYQIHASLLTNGTYVASTSSFYRILRAEGLMNHRSNTRPRKSSGKPPELVATGPNQVWTWDITWLRTTVRGLFFFAYTIIDIWDRSIVKWAIHDHEDDELAKELFQAALEDNGHPTVFVHSDNGHPMKGVSLLALFHELGITNSYSRPRVSDDNPFIESWFKTLKTHVTYPGTFESTESARIWFANFVRWYNDSHTHSGLHFMTPLQVRTGAYSSIIKIRNKTMQNAFEKNPIRWSKNVRQLPENHVVYLNPSVNTRLKLQQEKKVDTAA
jgi:putative transposase